MTIKARIYNNGDLQIANELIEYPPELEGTRNLFINSAVSNMAVGGSVANGNILENARYRGYFIPVNAGEIYSISRDSAINNRFDYGFTVEEPKDGVLISSGVAHRTDLKIESVIVPEGYNWLFLYLSNQGDEIPNMKIEKGNKTTKWTPAPEDLGLEYPDDIQHFGFSLSGNIVTHHFSETPDSLNFDGVNDYVEANAHSDLALTCTYETWFNVSSFVGWAGVIGNLKFNSPSSGFSVIPYSTYIRVCYGIGEGGYKYEQFSYPIEIGKWYHVAVSYDGSKFMAYLNGKFIGEFTGALVQNYDSFVLGRWANNYSSYLYNGLIRDARVWNKVLTQSEIQSNMNKELIGDEDSLIGYWKMDEGFGTVLNDSTDNNNDGTIHGATWSYSHDSVMRLKQGYSTSIKGEFEEGVVMNG